MFCCIRNKILNKISFEEQNSLLNCFNSYKDDISYNLITEEKYNFENVMQKYKHIKEVFQQNKYEINEKKNMIYILHKKTMLIL